MLAVTKSAFSIVLWCWKASVRFPISSIVVEERSFDGVSTLHVSDRLIHTIWSQSGNIIRIKHDRSLIERFGSVDLRIISHTNLLWGSGSQLICPSLNHHFRSISKILERIFHVVGLRIWNYRSIINVRSNLNLREGIAQNITPVIKINVFILKIWSGRVLIYSTGDIRSIIVGLSSLLALPALFLIFETLIFVNL